jgi:hypothetical protein
VFTLRDLRRVMQGMLLAPAQLIREREQVHQGGNPLDTRRADRLTPAIWYRWCDCGVMRCYVCSTTDW